MRDAKSSQAETRIIEKLWLCCPCPCLPLLPPQWRLSVADSEKITNVRMLCRSSPRHRRQRWLLAVRGDNLKWLSASIQLQGPNPTYTAPAAYARRGSMQLEARAPSLDAWGGSLCRGIGRGASWLIRLDGCGCSFNLIQ